MAIALEETVTAGNGGTGDYSLPSWTPGSDELVLVGVSTRGTRTTSSLSGNGLTFVQILEVTDDQNQETHSLWRAMISSSPSTGQISITLSATDKPSVAVAARFSGVDTSGTNGSGAVEASASANQGATDNDDMKVSITTLTDGAWALASGNNRNKDITPPDETTISINNYEGSGGDQLSASMFYEAVATAGAVTLGGDADLSGDSEWVLLAASVKPAAAGGGGGEVDLERGLGRGLLRGIGRGI